MGILLYLEIGIRKVLGASVPDLVVLLSGSFIRLALVAIIIAMPLAWWAMHRWLQDFSYRVNVGLCYGFLSPLRGS